jgi:putative oxidoreductase
MTVGILLLRLFFGLTLATHGAQKLFGVFGGGGPSGTARSFASLGFRAPLLMALAAGLSEFGGGLFLALGLLTPLAALAIAVVMLNAIGTVHWKKGFFVYAGGYEYNLLILVAAAAIAATGAGSASLDGAAGWESRISGGWWALGVLVLAPLVTFATLTFGRRPQR